MDTRLHFETKQPCGTFVLLTSDFSGIGGIQQTGRDAWSALTQWADGMGRSRCGLVSFADTVPPTLQSDAHIVGARGSVVRALWSGAVTRWHPRLLLCWHINLLPLALLLRSRGTKVLAFLHGIEAWRKLKLRTRFSARCVTQFLSNSDFTWRRFLECNPRFATISHRTVTLGLGEPLNGDGSACCGSPTAQAALMIARLSPTEDYKGHREMISCWPLVLQQLPAAQLWVAGDGDLRPELRRLTNLMGLTESVRFLGSVSEPEKESLIHRSRCLAMPSRAEGFGLVYLEAMRRGRPCLVSDRDAGREVVNPPEAGLSVNPDDPEALAGAVVRLLTEGPEWERWSRQARERYERHYTAGRFRQRLISACSEHL